MVPLYPVVVDISRTKKPDTELGPTLTTAERHQRDDLIMVRMFGLKMLQHKTGVLLSNLIEPMDVNRHNSLNAHAEALLCIRQDFIELFVDIPMDEDNFCTGSDVDLDSEDEMDIPQAEDGARGNDVMDN